MSGSWKALTSERKRGCFWGCLVSPKCKTTGLTFHQSFQPLEKVSRTAGGFCPKSLVSPEEERKLLPLSPSRQEVQGQADQTVTAPSLDSSCSVWSGRAPHSSWRETGGKDMGGTEGHEGGGCEKRKEENRNKTGEQMRTRAEFCERIVVETSHAHPDLSSLPSGTSQTHGGMTLSSSHPCD